MKMKVDIDQIHTLTIAPGEALLVRLPVGTSMATMNAMHAHLVSILETKKIVVYASDKIEFLKIQLEEQVVDELIERELKK